MLGYVHVFTQAGDDEGFVQFLGVRAEARQQGIGRRLLQAALHWLFEVKQMPQVTLTVADNLVNARSLYESVGFRLWYTGEHCRKDIS